MCELDVLGWLEKNLGHIQIRKHSRLPSLAKTQPFWPLGVKDPLVWAAETGYKSALV